MKTKKLNSNRILLYVKGIISFALIFAVVIFGINVISQTEKKAEDKIITGQKQPDIQDSDEVQKLIQILDVENKETSPQLIVEAIQKLGSIRDERAISKLVKYLDYEKKFEPKQNQDPDLKIDTAEVTHWSYTPMTRRYPAIEALFQIGKPTLPALVNVIKEENSESLKSQNALYIIQQIFIEDLLEGVKYLEDAMNISTTQVGKQRFLIAIEKTRKEHLKIQK